jgi:transposase-like protein
MISVDWKKDYQGEFYCPRCGKSGMRLSGSDIQGKRQFKCLECGKITKQSYTLKTRKPIIEGFICPECKETNIVFHNIVKGKKKFRCQSCQLSILDSIYLSKKNLSRYGHQSTALKSFAFGNDVWDLRAIHPSLGKHLKNIPLTLPLLITTTSNF